MDGLELFLAAHPDPTVVELVEVLLVDQAHQWQCTAGPSVEQYLQRFPGVSDQMQSVLELVYGEIRAARGLGLAIEAEAYEARFPDLAEPLRRQLQVSEWLRMNTEHIDSEDGPPA